MEAPPLAAHAPKKRKFDRVDGQKSPGSSSAGDGVSLDFINSLPDAVLCTIVSLLPTKDGARTQAVSRRWRPLWRSAPLNLVADSTLSGQERKRVVYVSKILAEHPGPALRFEIPYIRERYYCKTECWLRSQALTNLQELVFGYDADDSLPSLRPLLPPSALCFAPTLHVASFGGCRFPDLPAAQSLNFPHLKELRLSRVTMSNFSAPSLKFPHLKQLTLYGVSISGDALHSMLIGCLSLESLLLENNVGIGHLRISSSTLRSIGFSPPYKGEDATIFQELVIEDAPRLERLLPLNPDDGPRSIQVIRAPKLQVLGLLSDGISKLHIGTTVFQELTAISLTTTMHTMRILVIDSIGPNLDSVIGFLRCFPCLERLYVISHLRKEMKNVRKYDPLDPIQCLERHLKKVVLKNYFGNRPDVNFAKFFILNAKVLDEMNFGVFTNCNDKWMSNQHRRLQLDNRASRDARIEFKSSFWSTFTNNKHTHDLAMADPFENTF
ncbi:hypothetical protein QYE76_032997 [Lolium multiflorum]|uniref:FBD domain-containing protein n=1 Tax=Lolium multiflorum TaxID=4521 RepID=A0AAD8QWN0_LOLMU|nr:hypothetical protein QYE76_032997 [Lolium multiflorum]